jgi:hypothetical protein
VLAWAAREASNDRPSKKNPLWSFSMRVSVNEEPGGEYVAVLSPVLVGAEESKTNGYKPET